LLIHYTYPASCVSNPSFRQTVFSGSLKMARGYLKTSASAKPKPICPPPYPFNSRFGIITLFYLGPALSKIAARQRNP